MSVKCSGCDTVARVPTDAAGKRGRCRTCGGVVVVPAPASVAKICTVCRIDVSQRKRQKDQAGHYYCEHCARQISEQRRNAEAQQSTESLPDLLFCEKCYGQFTQDQLTLHTDGRVLCASCISRAAVEKFTAGWNKAMQFLMVSHLPLRDQYRRLGSRFRMSGIVLQLVFPALIIVLGQDIPPGSSAEAIILPLMGGCIISGGLSILVGLGYYARAKGRSRLWCWLGLLGIVGILVLWILPDNWVEPRRHSVVGSR